MDLKADIVVPCDLFGISDYQIVKQVMRDTTRNTGQEVYDIFITRAEIIGDGNKHLHIMYRIRNINNTNQVRQIEPTPVRAAPVEPVPVRTAPVELVPVRTAPVEPAPVKRRSVSRNHVVVRQRAVPRNESFQQRPILQGLYELIRILLLILWGMIRK